MARPGYSHIVERIALPDLPDAERDGDGLVPGHVPAAPMPADSMFPLQSLFPVHDTGFPIARQRLPDQDSLAPKRVPE